MWRDDLVLCLRLRGEINFIILSCNDFSLWPLVHLKGVCWNYLCNLYMWPRPIHMYHYVLVIMAKGHIYCILGLWLRLT
jgi:hypothetical protein